MIGPTPACQPPPAADTPAPPRFRFPHALIEIGCRYALAAVFLRAGAMKLAALDGFAAGFTVHLRIKPTLAIPLAAFIPWLELTCAFCLVLGTAKREAAAILGVLLIVFTAYALWVPAASDCGCNVFPPAWPIAQSRWWHVGLNVVLLGCAVRVVWRKGEAPDGEPLT